MTVITSSMAKIALITFVLADMSFIMVKITFVVAEIIVQEAMLTS